MLLLPLGCGADGSLSSEELAELYGDPAMHVDGVPTSNDYDPAEDPYATVDELMAAEPGFDGSTPMELADTSVIGQLTVRLMPKSDVRGLQRVNFAVPMPRGLVADAARVTVWRGTEELSAARRVLARHGDGSARSVQLQVNVNVDTTSTLDVRVGPATTRSSLTQVSVASTLAVADGTQGPKVWVLLPARWLANSGVVGPQVLEADVAGTPAAKWSTLCAYEKHDFAAFQAQMSDATVWLYDRATVNYRGHARRGDLLTLRTAYREAAVYLRGLSGSGSTTRIGVPGKSGDLKYHYAQNLAIHYLLTGDDRFREGAENVAHRVAALLPNPGYSGGSSFWTERNAGFALLAYVWAATVSDDKAAQFTGLADRAVDAYLAIQRSYPPGYTDQAARCFAHRASAHGESGSYFGCSPWMSAILADGLDAYATLRGGQRALDARASIVRLGRILARSGRDSTGRPLYFMGVGTSSAMRDGYDEHWGESAYVIAMAYYHGGRVDSGLRSAANTLVNGFASRGKAPHMRSVNWQCRSAVATPFYLR